MDIKNLYQSKKVRWILMVLIGVILILGIFEAGVMVGFKQASYSFKFGDNYYRAFQGPRGGTMGPRDPLFMNQLSGGHGAAGKIVSVSLPTFVVSGPDNQEKVVVITKDTEVKKYRDTASTSNIAADEFVVVLGVPNADGQIEARFIRILPKPEEATTSLMFRNR